MSMVLLLSNPGPDKEREKLLEKDLKIRFMWESQNGAGGLREIPFR